MNERSRTSLLSASGIGARWAARTLSAAILLFYGFFIIAHLVGSQGSPTRPLHAGDYIGLSAMAAWLLGLAVAWKWELAGAMVALAAVLGCAVLNWRIILFPGSIIIATAVLFLWSYSARRINSGA